MKDDWVLVLLIVLVAIVVYRQKQPALTKVIDMTRLNGYPPQIANLGALTTRKTRPMAERVTVITAGEPVQFPRGKPTSEIRVSTSNNIGDVHIGTSYVEAADTSSQHRFTIETANSLTLPFHPNDLSELWLDADSDGDGLGLVCEVDSN